MLQTASPVVASNINLFADDIALYRIITSISDYIALQVDINSINSCLGAKFLTLNPKKCCYLFISHKRVHSISPPPLTLGNSPLTCVASYKYLGLTITSDLMWSTHIATICNKTRKLVGMLYRRFLQVTHCSDCTPPSSDPTSSMPPLPGILSTKKTLIISRM